MANEFIARNGLISQNNSTVTGSLIVTQGITGSFSGSGANLNSIPTTAIVGDFSRIATGSVTASVTPTQFSVVSGSMTEFLVTGTGVTIGSAITDIHKVTGSLLVTGSNTIIGPKIVTGSLTVTGPNTATSGFTSPIVNTSSFSPTTGNGTYAGIYEGSTINQTSGSTTGIVRGIYNNPTLTSAYEYRAFESTNGRVVITDTFSASGSSIVSSYNPAVLISQTLNNAGTLPTQTFRVDTYDVASSATSNLMQFNLSSSATTFQPVLTLTKGGVLYFGQNGAGPYVGTVSPTTGGGGVLQKSIGLRHYLISEAGYGVWVNALSSTRTNSAGQECGLLRLSEQFTPTAGASTHNSLNISTTVSQSGAASGITRGLYVNPTLTNAQDFRAIEAVSGSIVLPYSTATTTYSVKTSDYLVNFTTAGFTASLATAVGCTGKTYILKNSAVGQVVVATTSAQTIDGAATYTLTSQYKYIQVVSNGANWIITGNN
jgi:hypothetical protein